MYHDDILDLYTSGMSEAWRVLKWGGYLWVKCKDELESSTQRWSHIELFLIAVELGFYAKDLFILTQTQNPIIQHKAQQHSRKNHSYLWVFEKLSGEKNKGNQNKIEAQQRRLRGHRTRDEVTGEK
jgi:hypothetical protein